MSWIGPIDAIILLIAAMHFRDWLYNHSQDAEGQLRKFREAFDPVLLLRGRCSVCNGKVEVHQTLTGQTRRSCGCGHVPNRGGEPTNPPQGGTGGSGYIGTDNVLPPQPNQIPRVPRHVLMRGGACVGEVFGPHRPEAGHPPGVRVIGCQCRECMAQELEEAAARLHAMVNAGGVNAEELAARLHAGANTGNLKRSFPLDEPAAPYTTR